MALDADASALAVRRRLDVPVYSVTDLGTLGGTMSAATAINDKGQETGYSTLAGDPAEQHAFLYNGTAMLDLGTLSSATGTFTESRGSGINERGQVSGTSAGTRADGGGVSAGFLYSWGSLHELAVGNSHGPYVTATGLNNRGDVVGVNSDADTESAGFIFSDGTPTWLGTLGGTRGNTPYGINDLGHVTGTSTAVDTSGAYAPAISHAYLYKGGKMHDLGTLGGYLSVGYGINAGDAVTGHSMLTNDRYSDVHAFLSDDRSMRDLGVLGVAPLAIGYSAGQGINDDRQVVGMSSTSSPGDSFHAFIWSGGTMYDLNGLLDSSGANWTLGSATAINNRGQIVGSGLIDGQPHAFLLTPTKRELHAGRWSRAEIRVDDVKWRHLFCGPKQSSVIKLRAKCPNTSKTSAES